MLERRKHQRDDLMEVLNCAPLPNNSGSIFRGLIQDYSNSGLCLITNRAIEKGQEIIVNHRIMPSSKRATVKWQQNISEVAYKVGIESSKENELKVKFYMSSRSKKKAKDHPLLWVVESLMEVPSYLAKPMFGCLGIYLHGRLMLVLASGEEPWDGLLVPTEHQFHDAILKEFRDVVQHSVLKKWLYLPEATEDFETLASDIVEAVKMNDQRFGVEPQEKVSRKKK